jgi:membrane fusion protein (multidrug efflux system)
MRKILAKNRPDCVGAGGSYNLDMRRRWKWLLPLGGAIALAGVVAAWLQLRTWESTDDARIDGHIAGLSSRVAGVVTRVTVEENQAVRAGQPLITLDARDYAVALDRAEAELAMATAQLAEAERDHDAARARVRQAAEGARLAETDRRRYRFLASERAVPPQLFDDKLSAARVSDAALAAARSTALASPVEARTAAVKMAQAALERARLDLDYTRIAAPFSGVVARRAAEPGMRVAPGQELLALVDTNDLWVTADFKETQLRRIRPGQRARCKVDALGIDFDGQVESVGAATGARVSVLPPENATGNWVKVVQRMPVRIRLRAGQAGLERLRPGMSVEPRVYVK